MGVRAHRIKTVNQMIVVGGWVQKPTKLIDDIVDLATVVHVARPYHRTIAGRATLLLNKQNALKAIATCASTMNAARIKALVPIAHTTINVE